MRMSPQEMRVFQTVLLQAKVPFSEIARSLKMREHTVRRVVASLRERGVILGTQPYLNHSALGLQQFVIYFSLIEGNEAVRNKFVTALCADEHVSFVAEVGGDFHYEVNILVRHHDSIIDFLDKLAGKFKAKIQTPAIAMVHRREYSGIRYCAAKVPTSPSLISAPVSSVIKIDRVDHGILSLLCNERIESRKEIGRRLGIPASTVDYRIRSLEEKGAIVGHYYLCDPKMLGEIPFSLLVHADLITAAKRERLLKYCREHDRISHMTTNIGAWQAAIWCRVADYQEAQRVLHELYAELGDAVNAIRFMPQLNFYKFSYYPFHDFRSVCL